jgi:hypothetical protein
VVTEAPFIGGKTLFPSEPAEDLALKGGCTPPNLYRHVVHLQVAEKTGIEILVCKQVVSEAANT